MSAYVRRRSLTAEEASDRYPGRRHGSMSMYVGGCGCGPCVRAGVRYSAARHGGEDAASSSAPNSPLTTEHKVSSRIYGGVLFFRCSCPESSPRFHPMPCAGALCEAESLVAEGAARPEGDLFVVAPGAVT